MIQALIKRFRQSTDKRIQNKLEITIFVEFILGRGDFQTFCIGMCREGTLILFLRI